MYCKNYIAFIFIQLNLTLSCSIAFTQAPQPAMAPMGCELGYKDSVGNWLIEPQFEDAEKFIPDFPYYGHYAKIKSGGYFGLINRKGEIALKPEYTEIRPAFSIDSSDYFKFAPRQKLVYTISNALDYSNRWNYGYGYIHPVHYDFRINTNGYIQFQEKKICLLKNNNGFYRLYDLGLNTFQYEALDAFEISHEVDGVRFIQVADSIYLIRNTHIIYRAQYAIARPLLHNLYSIYHQKTGKFEIINNKGKLIQKQEFDSIIYQWKGSLLAAKSGSTVYLLDSTGNIQHEIADAILPKIISPTCNGCQAYFIFWPHCFGVRSKNGLMWLFNSQGQLVINQPVRIQDKALGVKSLSKFKYEHNWYILERSGHFNKQYPFDTIIEINLPKSFFSGPRTLMSGIRNDSTFIISERNQIIYQGQTNEHIEIMTLWLYEKAFFLIYNGSETFFYDEADNYLFKVTGKAIIHNFDQNCGKKLPLIVCQKDGFYALFDWGGKMILPFVFDNFDEDNHNRYDANCSENSVLTGSTVFSIHDFLTENKPFKTIPNKNFGCYEVAGKTIFFDENGKLLKRFNCKIKEQRHNDTANAEMYLMDNCGAYIPSKNIYLPNFNEVKEWSNFKLFYRTDGKLFRGKYKYLRPFGDLGFIGCDNSLPISILNKDTQEVFKIKGEVFFDEVESGNFFYEVGDYYRACNFNGETVKKLSDSLFYAPFSFYDGLAIFANKRHKLGIINENFEILLPPNFEFVYRQKGVGFFVFNAGKSFIVFQKGNKLINGPYYINCSTFRNDTAIMQPDSSIRALTTNGEIIELSNLKTRQIKGLLKSFEIDPINIPNQTWSIQQKRRYLELRLELCLLNHTPYLEKEFFQEGDTIAQILKPRYKIHIPSRQETSQYYGHLFGFWTDNFFDYSSSSKSRFKRNHPKYSYAVAHSSASTVSIITFANSLRTPHISHYKTYLLENERYAEINFQTIFDLKATDTLEFNTYLFNKLSQLEDLNFPCTQNQNLLKKLYTICIDENNIILILQNTKSEIIEVPIPKKEISNYLKPIFR
ncbi:hypothetical protein GC194_02000 [bacterium]|nr:hypothetical protein [bacterium]